jgi:hypothetical protein
MKYTGLSSLPVLGPSGTNAGDAAPIEPAGSERTRSPHGQWQAFVGAMPMPRAVMQPAHTTSACSATGRMPGGRGGAQVARGLRASLPAGLNAPETDMALAYSLILK